MSFDLNEIKLTTKSFSYVVIWKNVLGFIPPLSTEFFKELFQNQNILYGFTPDGLAVSLNTNNIEIPSSNHSRKIIKISPAPHLTIGYNSFIYLHTDYDKFLKIYEKLIEELKSKYNNFFHSLKPAQIGINIEYEIILPHNILNYAYFRERFRTNNVASFGFKDIIPQEFLFQLVEEGKEKLTQIRIQPLLDNSNGLYIHANDHFGNSPSENIFTIDQLKRNCDR